MKVTKVSLILDRQIEDQMGAILLQNEEKTEAEMIINFRSIDTYKAFVRNPILLEKHFDKYDAFIFLHEGIQSWTKTDEFINIIRNNKLHYNAYEEKKI